MSVSADVSSHAPPPRPRPRKPLWYRILFQRLWPRTQLYRLLARDLEGRVFAGPFKGMVYGARAVWGNPANKLLGTYEKELTPFIEALDLRPAPTVFDIGASEGYFAVGFARRWPSCRVVAWELDQESRDLLLANAVANGVADRLAVLGSCEEPALVEGIQQHRPTLVMMDVEGLEVALCSPRALSHGAAAWWIVECHAPAILRTLQHRFDSTHEVDVVVNSPRTAADVPAGLPCRWLVLPHDRWRLVDEGRPMPTPWLVARPKANAGLR